MSTRIESALQRLFEKHRIVFWYDAKQELREDYETLALPGVAKCEITNNEFGLKYQLLRAAPEQKFLLYHQGPQPAPLDNWLLDVLLAHTEFRTDQVGIWLAELELGMEFSDLVSEHADFFRTGSRRERLKKLLQPDDTIRQLKAKMLAVCVFSEPRLDAILESLLQELAEGGDEQISLIERCGLLDFLWEQLFRDYGYASSNQSIRDFQLRIFQDCYEMELDPEKYELARKQATNEQKPSRMAPQIQVFLKRWKDSRQFEQCFETLSAECAEVLAIEKDLGQRDFRALMAVDYFRLIDLKIIHDLVKEVVNQTVSSGDVSLWVRQRRQGHWYQEFRHLYEAIDYAARFMHLLEETRLTMTSLIEGVQNYSQRWFLLDQHYRKFTYHVRQSGQTSLMQSLAEKIENLYSNSYLLKVNNAFQAFVDSASQWNASPVPLQKQFFERWVRPFLRKDNKVCVIISDALRYEIGDELLSRIRQEDRYGAELEPALSMLPSYTQLGMAALLPNTSLSIADNDSGSVLLDGQSTQGTANRHKILQQALNGKGCAVTYEDVMAMNRDTSRELLKANDVVYIYHNRIDHTGDKMHSEGQAFEAAEQTQEELLRLVKKLTAANASNIIVTADHGFIYQNRELAESDFANINPEGSTILYRDRRFVLGKGLQPSPRLRSFTPDQLGLAGEVEVQIPKSINRLRLKGSGSRFVHGGAALQEVVIPVLKINKKRQSDVSYVEVEILRGTSSVITAGQVAVTLYQSGPVTDKVQPRQLRAGIYNQAGELISDSRDLLFDLTSDNPRERELQLRFVMSRQADNANGQEVFLRLEEQHEGTSHFKEYKSVRYEMRRAFTSDFDF